VKDEKKMCGVFAAASLGVMVGVHQLASSVVQQYFLFLCVGGMEVDSCLLRDEITIDTITQEWRVIIFLFLIVRWYSVANNVTYFGMEKVSFDTNLEIYQFVWTCIRDIYMTTRVKSTVHNHPRPRTSRMYKFDRLSRRCYPTMHVREMIVKV
jgi:hypothetical protein